MWARSPSTVLSVKRSVMDMLKCWKQLGVTPNLPKLGPWPLNDKVGFRVAIAQLKMSQRPGVNCTTHLQFDTVRKMRTAYSHLHETSSSSVLARVNSFRTQLGKVFNNSSSPTQSLLYVRFNYGLLLRMGRQTVHNVALDYMLLHKILDNLESILSEDNLSVVRRRWITMVGGYLIITFVLALRGNEGFMVEAGGLLSYIDDGRTDMEPNIAIPLLGSFKNEDGERWHIMLSVSVTKSGFDVRKWAERIVNILRSENKNSGPAFCHAAGKAIKSSELDTEFHNQLEVIQDQRPDLIKPNINIREMYSVFRSLRRGCTSRTGELNVPDNVVNLHNRWRNLEYKGYAHSPTNMRALYTELRLTRQVRLQFTRDL